MKKLINILILTALIAQACSSEDDPCFQCNYETRRSSCSSSSFGEWESESSQHDRDNIRDDLNPESFCALIYPSSDIECSTTCCISFQFRNVEAVSCQ